MKKSWKSSKRYNGQKLGSKAHIAVLGSHKVGNFIVSLPLLRSLRSKYSDAVIDFWGSNATRDFEEALCNGSHPLLNWRISWDQEEPDVLQVLAKASETRGRPDLVINCDGFNPVTQVLASWLRPKWIAGGALINNCHQEMEYGSEPSQKFLGENDWDSEDFIRRYKGIFSSNYIADLLCHMAYVTPPPQEIVDAGLPWVEPKFRVPPVLIHCTSTRSAKIWPFDHWARVLYWCKENGVSAGLIGSAPTKQIIEYNSGNGEDKLVREFGNEGCGTLIDLRGKTNLIELAGACKRARAVVSVDAGPMHVAAAVGTHVMAVVGNDELGIGASPIRLWLPRAAKLHRTISTETCGKCAEENFKNVACIAESHRCMHGVDPLQVITWLKQIVI